MLAWCFWSFIPLAVLFSVDAWSLCIPSKILKKSRMFINGLHSHCNPALFYGSPHRPAAHGSVDPNPKYLPNSLQKRPNLASSAATICHDTYETPCLHGVDPSLFHPYFWYSCFQSFGAAAKFGQDVGTEGRGAIFSLLPGRLRSLATSWASCAPGLDLATTGGSEIWPSAGRGFEPKIVG
ncbi:hypothetical protein DFH08DRAFT_804564 [Mycena albidolilacea]|uniref:Secreted protein n=1 Tax=Mycena albidolilacea TaxID=1033008 RepID=A0AAD7ADI6_9AGAR|nr:hypothetical protein DFH08DRAFT_804564 [Mycena albidolilacea]